MKNLKLLAVLFISSIIVTSCSDDDSPEHIHDEEVITTMKVVLTPETGGDAVTLEWKDIEDHDEEHEEDHGEEHEEPEITGGTLMANTTYNAEITLLNEYESPADNITLEVIEEAEEHQFFYTASGIASTFTYSDSDADGKPLGVEFTVTTGAAGKGSYTIFLKHEPTKSDTNDMTNVGGETDIEATFPITVK